jgi:transketolase
MKLSQEKIIELQDYAYKIRQLSLEMITCAKWGHLGGSFSMAEIMSVLYFHFMQVDPKNPDWLERDRLILSKAHSSPALYSALALRGFFPIKDLYNYCQVGGLEGHTDMRRTKGLEASGGSLGMGLSIAVGIALGLRLKEIYNSRVFCIVGDGEMMEGNIWEAAMSAAKYRLDNLITILDYNKVSAKGFIYEIMNLEPLRQKWESFGWEVLEIDGHDISEINDAFNKAKYIFVRGKPILLIANTVKGFGIKEAEFNYKWHSKRISPEESDRLLRALSKQYHKPEQGYSRINKENEEK